MTWKRLILAAVRHWSSAPASCSAPGRPICVQSSCRSAAVQRDVAVEVFGLGTVEARVTSKIGFKVSGVLVELRADVGDRVVKGAVLARLDDREQRGAGRPGPKPPPSRPKRTPGATASAQKAQANFANAKAIQPASAKAGAKQQRLGRNGRDGKDGARRRTCRREFGRDAISRWRGPPSATPRHNCSRKARHSIFTRWRRPTTPW